MIRALYKRLNSLSAPRMIHYRVNAGPLPADHWLKDLQKGGGRILGELCHFIDLVTTLVPAAPKEIYARSMEGGNSEDVAVQMSFADGSQAQILYTAQGASHLPKEILEVFCAGHAFVLDNFQKLTFHDPKKSQSIKRFNQDKGYAEELA